MYQEGVCQELQVLIQLLSLTQFKILIQVQLVAGNSQTFHMESHQWSIIMILDLKHNMYQLGVYPWNQLL